MSRRYAIFDQSQLGPALEIRQGGEVIGIQSDGLDADRTARADIGVTGDTHYVEFVVWGEDDMEAAVGIVTEDASLSTYVGGDAEGIGYRLEAGEIRIGGVSVASVGAAAKGDVIGVLLDFQRPDPAVTFYRNGLELHSESVESSAWDGAIWYAGASLGSDLEADLQLFMNTGARAFEFQNPVADGWYEVPTTIDAIWLGAEDDTTEPDDLPPNQRIEGVLPQANTAFTVERSLAFWTDGDSSVTRPNVASLTILDPLGEYDELISGAVRDLPVTVYDGELGAALAAYEVVGSYVIERVQALDDSQKRLVLKDGAGKFDDPLQRRLFLPSVEESAANRPRPISLGAVLSMSPVLYDSANRDYAIHDAPLLGFGFVRDRGDVLELDGSPPDYEVTPDGEGIRLNNNPAGKITADVSSIGGDLPIPPTSLTPDNLAGWDIVDNVTESGGVYTFADDFNANFGVVESRLGMSGILEANKTYRYRLVIDDMTGFFGGTGQRTRIQFMRAVSGGGQPQLLLGGTEFVEPGSYAGTFTNWSSGTNDFIIGMIGTGSLSDFAEIRAALTLYEVTDQTVDSDNLVPITLADFAQEVLEVRGGFAAAEYDIASAEAIDDLTGYAGVGWHTAEQVTVRRPLEDVLPSYSACLAQDRQGVFRFYRLESPEARFARVPETLQGTIVGFEDLLNDLKITPDEAPGLTLRFALQRNETILDPTDFVDDFDPVTGVPLSVRRALGRPYRQIVATGGRVAQAYPFAYAAAAHETRFLRTADAQAELDRVREIYSVERTFYVCEVPLDSDYDLDQLWLLQYDRYSLGAGKLVIVRRIVENRVDRTATLTLWG